VAPKKKSAKAQAAPQPAESDDAVPTRQNPVVQEAVSAAVSGAASVKLAFDLEKKTKPVYDALDVRYAPHLPLSF
jgi:hypothetical protein